WTQQHPIQKGLQTQDRLPRHLKLQKQSKPASATTSSASGEPKIFTVFEIDHQYDTHNGNPYAKCGTYTCTAPSISETEADANTWVHLIGGMRIGVY
ncbi:hypothetical protein F1880_010164, partial [Penicillium rolfsii]